jgi:hypothetical protein
MLNEEFKKELIEILTEDHQEKFTGLACAFPSCLIYL